MLGEMVLVRTFPEKHGKDMANALVNTAGVYRERYLALPLLSSNTFWIPQMRSVIILFQCIANTSNA